MKVEGVRPNSPADLEDACRILTGYIADYNEVRLHSAIDYLPPMVRLRGEHTEWQARRRERLRRAREARNAPVSRHEKENRFSSSKQSDKKPLLASEERGQEIPQAGARGTRAEPRTVLDAEREAGPEPVLMTA